MITFRKAKREWTKGCAQGYSPPSLAEYLVKYLSMDDQLKFMKYVLSRMYDAEVILDKCR